MSFEQERFEVGDVHRYPLTYNNYFVSSQSKMYFSAGYIPTNGTNVYRVRLGFPDSTSYLYGYSRNLLAFTGNTSAISENAGMYEWYFASDEPCNVSLTTNYGTGESGGSRTKYTFGPLTSSTYASLLGQYIRTPIKARHNNFIFTASVKATAGEVFNIEVGLDNGVGELEVTGTGDWQYISIPITVTSKSDLTAFQMGARYRGSTSGGASLEMIEPMLAVADSYSNTYTWCPNCLDNYRYYPKNESFANTYITETREAYFDWVDNTHTPKVSATTTGYAIKVNADYYSGKTATSATHTTTDTVNVVAYNIPSITKNAQTGELNAVAYRTDQNGDPTDEGDYFASEYDVTTSPVPKTGGNMITYFRIGWRQYPNGSLEYDTSAPSQLAGTSAHLTMFPGEVVDPVYAWEVVLEYKDDFVSDYTAVNYLMVPDAYALIDFHYTGRGLSLGKVSTTESVEKGGVELGMPVYLDDGFGFINADNDNPTGVTDPTVISADDDMGIIMNKMTQMMANLRYMYTPKAVEVTQPSSLPAGVTSCSVNVVKCGFIVQVAIEFVLSATIANWAAVVTSGMPRQFGSSSIIVTASSFSTGSPRACRVSVGTSGNLQLRYGESGTYRITFCYIANG